jgi:hypothetical protein
MHGAVVQDLSSLADDRRHPAGDKQPSCLVQADAKYLGMRLDDGRDIVLAVIRSICWSTAVFGNKPKPCSWPGASMTQFPSGAPRTKKEARMLAPADVPPTMPPRLNTRRSAASVFVPR